MLSFHSPSHSSERPSSKRAGAVSPSRYGRPHSIHLRIAPRRFRLSQPQRKMLWPLVAQEPCDHPAKGANEEEWGEEGYGAANHDKSEQ
jgi:hypothetical protein